MWTGVVTGGNHIPSPQSPVAPVHTQTELNHSNVETNSLPVAAEFKAVCGIGTRPRGQTHISLEN